MSAGTAFLQALNRLLYGVQIFLGFFDKLSCAKNLIFNFVVSILPLSD
jgi:hypothetical protein